MLAKAPRAKFAPLLALSALLLALGAGCVGEEAKHKAAGNVLFKRKDYPGAEREYRKAVAAKPKDAGAHMLLAEALFNQKMLTEAQAEFRLALELKPKSADAHKGMAEVILGLAPAGDPTAIDAALGHLDQVLAVKKSDYTTLVYSAKLLSMKAGALTAPALRVAAFDRAMARISSARDATGKDPAVLYELAIIASRRAVALRAAGAADADARAKADEAMAAQALADLERQATGSWVVPYARAVVALVRDQKDEALGALKEALARPDANRQVLETDSNFAGLREDPRYQALLPR